MAFGRKKDSPATEAPDAPDVPKVLDSYDVSYKGGLPGLPKSKVGKVKMEIFSDRFQFMPTMGSKGFWSELNVPYDKITDLQIVERTVGTFEGIAGGLNSKQLNQKNNIHIAYSGADGNTLLRLEMLSGVTVMGQAKKCNELEDRLRNFHIREQFVADTPAANSNPGGLSAELTNLAALKASGVLTDEEFVAAKTRLLEA
jgi:Short C-terminal domain